MAESTKAKKLDIKLVRSPIGQPQRQKGTLRALGLRRINQVVSHDDTPVVRGMIEKVSHLVEVQE